MKKTLFLLPLLILASCLKDNNESGGGGSYVGTWIFNGDLISSNVTGYTPTTDGRYDQYKYLDLFNNGEGSLWGGDKTLEGLATWDAGLKEITMTAKADVSNYESEEIFQVDSITNAYLSISDTLKNNDTVAVRRFYFYR